MPAFAARVEYTGAARKAEPAAMSEDEIQRYAYMDMDAAVTELTAKTLYARNCIIFSKSWAADKGTSVYYPDTGVTVEVPTFYELFPANWKNPGYAEFDLVESVSEDILPKTKAERAAYAYSDLDQAVEALKTKIISARNTLIYRQSWVADGYEASYVDPETGETVVVPQFSELFPGWDLPVDGPVCSAEELSNLEEDGIMPLTITPYNYYNRAVPYAREGVVANPINSGAPIPTAGGQKLEACAYSFRNLTKINIGFTNAQNGTSLSFLMNLPEYAKVTWTIPSSGRPSHVFIRASQANTPQGAVANFRAEKIS